LIKNGFTEEAWEQAQPMFKRVKDNNGFYEWYSLNNEPRGSGTFRGEAGVLFTAIRMFETEAKKEKIVATRTDKKAANKKQKKANKRQARQRG
jgi:hypothetical protein